MSTATFPAGTYNFDRPSAGVGLTRRGRLARTLLVLSLSIVLGAGFAMKAGAGNNVAGVNANSSASAQSLKAAKINGSSASNNGASDAAKSYVVVTVAAGETLWSLASQMADGGDVQSLVADIASANSLSGVDVEAGQKLRVPIK
ncbi:MAG: LysM peptidoglycan-binding domain-containing protein [Actinobacteria bacterium]|nr:LysM peptidoglycan-binding domain-containing protein [Actinomycetota bacterium]